MMGPDCVALFRELYQLGGGNPDELMIEAPDFGRNVYRVRMDDKEETLKKRDLEGRNFIPIQIQLARLQ